MTDTKASESRAWTRWALLACSLVALGLALAGSRLQSTTRTSQGKASSLGRPEALVSFAEFSRLLGGAGEAIESASELSRRQLLFVGDLAQIGQHNLWALTRDSAREPTYFLRQTPASAYLTADERLSLMGRPDEHLVEMLARGLESPVSQAGAHRFDGFERERSESPVSQASAHKFGGPELEKSSMLGHWFKRVVNSNSYFEIPNFPLDQQPNPEKITHIDADLRPCTDVIKNQYDCGACYAFSFVSLAEWHLCKQTDNQLVDLSEQYIVDCGGKVKLDGCKEGRLSYVRKFVQFFGMKYERDHKYVAHEKTCTNKMLSENILKLKINDWKRIKIDREVFERTLEEQPIVLEVRVPSDFMSYSRGVHPGHNCDPKIGHGMLLVGHGRQDGVPYWLLRNSMGKKWGENGYLRLSRDMPEMRKCFRTGFVGKFKFGHVDEDKYQDLYENLRYDPPEDDFDNDHDAQLLSWLKNQTQQ